jgi:hypothetical protein
MMIKTDDFDKIFYYFSSLDTRRKPSRSSQWSEASPSSSGASYRQYRESESESVEGSFELFSYDLQNLGKSKFVKGKNLSENSSSTLISNATRPFWKAMLCMTPSHAKGDSDDDYYVPSVNDKIDEEESDGGSNEESRSNNKRNNSNDGDTGSSSVFINREEQSNDSGEDDDDTRSEFAVNDESTASSHDEDSIEF